MFDVFHDKNYILNSYIASLHKWLKIICKKAKVLSKLSSLLPQGRKNFLNKTQKAQTIKKRLLNSLTLKIRTID